ncbi:MAG: SAM-dependent methyltransferase [Cyanobium sp. CACIAM 14]|nr:MAG: SAM-dependent methyltransferase [Cyanobium sp. CACIAM 14]
MSPFSLDEIVPWGRSFEEYRAMFRLTEADLSGRILGCGDGPASFNAEASRLGASIVSCDPIYRWDVEELRARIAQTCDQVLEQTRRNRQAFVWTSIPSVDELGRTRMAAMEKFLADYPEGLKQGRYVVAELPVLPFAHVQFDLALCSHLLFLYGSQLGEAFHHAALLELARVAKEVRVFPLLALGGEPSPFVRGCVDLLEQTGHRVTIETVPYEFQRGGNQMLRFRRSSDG